VNLRGNSQQPGDLTNIIQNPYHLKEVKKAKLVKNRIIKRWFKPGRERQSSSVFLKTHHIREFTQHQLTMSTNEMAGGFDGVPDLVADSGDESDKELTSPDMVARMKKHTENKKAQNKVCNNKRRVLFKRAEEPSTMQYMPRKVEHLLKMPAADILKVR